MSNDLPGVYNTPFKITLMSNVFRKGDAVKSAEGTELIVVSEPKAVYSWWKKLILWIFRREKLRTILANGYTYTVKLKHADQSS